MRKILNETPRKFLMDFLNKDLPLDKNVIYFGILIFWVLELINILTQTWVLGQIIIFSTCNLYITYIGYLLLNNKKSDKKKEFYFLGIVILYGSFHLLFLSFYMLVSNFYVSFLIFPLMFLGNLLMCLVAYFIIKNRIIKGKLKRVKYNSKIIMTASILFIVVIKFILISLIKNWEYADIFIGLGIYLTSLVFTFGIVFIMKFYCMVLLESKE